MASAVRLTEALDVIGSSLTQENIQAFQNLANTAPTAETVAAIQKILDPYCIAMVNISPEACVKVHTGLASATLIQNGWTSFLVKIHNEANTNAKLAWKSANADPDLHQSPV